MPSDGCSVFSGRSNNNPVKEPASSLFILYWTPLQGESTPQFEMDLEFGLVNGRWPWVNLMGHQFRLEIKLCHLPPKAALMGSPLPLMELMPNPFVLKNGA